MIFILPVKNVSQEELNNFPKAMKLARSQDKLTPHLGW